MAVDHTLLHNACVAAHIAAYRHTGFDAHPTRERPASHYLAHEGKLYAAILASSTGKNGPLTRVANLLHYPRVIIIESTQGKAGEVAMLDTLKASGFRVVKNGRGIPDAVMASDKGIEAIEVETMAFPSGEPNTHQREQLRHRAASRSHYDGLRLHIHDPREAIGDFDQRLLSPPPPPLDVVRRACNLYNIAHRLADTHYRQPVDGTALWPYPSRGRHRLRFVDFDAGAVTCRIQYFDEQCLPVAATTNTEQYRNS